MKRKVRQIQTTILFVGEGLTEKIFIEYVRGMYSGGKAKVRVVSANGKGPDNVIKHAISLFQQDGYDHCCAFLDLDLPWPDALVREAKRKKIVLIGSAPCVEGLFLDILSKKIPKTSNGCKQQFNEKELGGANVIDKKFLTRVFTRDLLETRRVGVAPLDKVLRCLEGGIQKVITEDC